jgi:phospholipid/cholesterol/gamma-HCH transport system substrate-binding protein
MNRANPKAIGLFVLGGLTLAVVAIVALGSGRLFAKSHRFILFFPGDVSGLKVGASVKFRGVPVGTVDAIRLNFGDMMETQASATSAQKVRIPVIIELNETQITRKGGNLDLNDPTVIQRLIRRGLRAQLGTESLLTGLAYVSLDLKPDTKAMFYLPQGGTYYPEIPTVPTMFAQTEAAVEAVVNKLNQTDLPSLVDKASAAMKAVHDLVTSPGLQKAIDHLNETEQSLRDTTQSLKRLSDNLNDKAVPLLETLRDTSHKAGELFTDSRASVESVRSTLGPGSPTIVRMNQSLADVSSAARAVHNLADELERNPTILVRGKYIPADGK